jgi:hypothetical protein
MDYDDHRTLPVVPMLVSALAWTSLVRSHFGVAGKPMIVFLAALLEIAFPVYAQPSSSQPVNAVSPTQIFAALNTISEKTRIGITPEYTVKDTVYQDGQVFAADVLIFLPNSKLVFAGPAGDKTERYVFARVVRLPAGGPPPIITWARDNAAQAATPVGGKAPAGSMGAVEGADGGPGADGQSGNPGFPGRSAPTIYMFVGSVEGEGGPLMIDLQGQNGGVGGQGQVGGDGGIGRAGQPAVSGLFDCRAGGGKGGNGGRGGNGGQGGPGGRGGSGGTFILLSGSDGLASVKGHVGVRVDLGKGGARGSGGDRGLGGPSGQGGNGNGLCSGGPPGAQGLPGSVGLRGDTGPDGVVGVVAFSEMTGEQTMNLRIR